MLFIYACHINLSLRTYVDKRVSKGKRVQREDFSEKQEEEEVNVGGECRYIFLLYY